MDASEIDQLNEKDFDSKVLDAKGKVFVEFFATWCPHCQRMMPIVAELDQELAGACPVYQVDVDKNHDLASEYAPNGFPTFVVFEDGEIVADKTGEHTLDQLVEMVEES